MQEYKVTVDTTGTIRFYKPGTYELHRLKMALPTFSEEREAARDRIKARIAERRRGISKITGGAA